MTTDERFDRMEHVTAGLAEERRKDREEYRQLWRDTQRQIQELTLSIADFRSATEAAIADTNSAIRQTNEAIARSDHQAKIADQELRDRIQSLVSGIGEILSRSPKP
jgi:hypothetical protein